MNEMCVIYHTSIDPDRGMDPVLIMTKEKELIAENVYGWVLEF